MEISSTQRITKTNLTLYTTFKQGYKEQSPQHGQLSQDHRKAGEVPNSWLVEGWILLQNV